MDKKKIRSEIEDTINLIKGNSKDAHFCDTLIERLMSLKGQIDVEPMLAYIPLTGKEEVIDTGGAYSITRNSHGVVFHVNGLDFIQRKDGVDVIIKNRNKLAHCPYDRLFELWNKKKEDKVLSEEENAEYESLLLAGVTLPQTPFVACVKPEWQATLVILVDEWFSELSNLLNADLQPEVSEETMIGGVDE